MAELLSNVDHVADHANPPLPLDSTCGEAAPAAHAGAPQRSFDLPAGVPCDFAIRGEPVVDEVRRLVISSNPDGSARGELYEGDLVMAVTNTETGAKTLADASGTAFVEHAADGSETWFVVGPILFGFPRQRGHPAAGRGWSTAFSRSSSRPTWCTGRITMVHGTTHNVCTDID